MKRWKKILAALGLLSIAAVCFANKPGDLWLFAKIRMTTGGVTEVRNNTLITGNLEVTGDISGNHSGKTPVFASGTIASGAATATITVAGVDSNDSVFGTLATTGAAQSIRTIVPGSGTVVVVTSGNVSTTTTVQLIAWED